MAIEIEALVKMSAFAGAGLCMGFGAIGAAIGEGFAAGKANEAISRNPGHSGEIFKMMLVGQAVAETAAIFALVIGVLLLFTTSSPLSLIAAAALMGAGLCMGFGAIGSGVGSGFPAGEACSGISRQPAMSNRLTTNMLVGSAVSQTPAIFAMVVAFMLMFMDFSNAPVHPTSAALLGAALATGLAAIGSGLGSGLAAGANCEGSARQPMTSGNGTVMMLVGQAVSQTPSIFGLLISFVLMFKTYAPSELLGTSMALLGAGLSVGFGGIGPGVGNGKTAQSAVTWVARNIEQESLLMRTMLVGQAVSQSTAIYAMVVSLALIFLV